MSLRQIPRFSRVALLLLLGITFLLIGGFLLLVVINMPISDFLGRVYSSFITMTPTNVSNNFSAEQNPWLESIDKLGGRNAYEKFVASAYAARPYIEQHEAAHLFGEALYKKMGLAGLGICDSSFAYGCYHGFLGSAITDRGIDVISSLDAACRNAFGSRYEPCQHGIGHGILAYLGDTKIVQALDACLSLPSQRPTGGCLSGVFMEHNFRTMSDPLGKGIAIRSFSSGDNPHEPCASLPPKYKQSCYFEQPQWWQSVFGGNYDKIGKLCNEIKDDTLTQVCFEGTGNYAAAFTGYNVQRTIDLCERMPTANSIIFCREGASWIFLAVPNGASLAPKLCEGFSKTIEEECLQKLRNNPFAG